MNVLVIGAAGKTGKLTVQRAVAAGHAVTAFVRDATKYTAPPGVTVATGDATDPASVAAAMAGQQAVIDTVGGKTPWKHTELERTVAAAVLAAMRQHAVRRLIAVSALGVGDSTAQSGFLYEHLLLPTFLRGSTADKAAMEAAVRQASAAGGIDYVLVRPAILTDQPATGSVRTFDGDHTAHKITRADVAAFLVEQLTSDAHLNRAVTIANT
jgi:putative NADH-flavin reductase